MHFIALDPLRKKTENHLAVVGYLPYIVFTVDRWNAFVVHVTIVKRCKFDFFFTSRRRRFCRRRRLSACFTPNLIALKATTRSEAADNFNYDNLNGITKKGTACPTVRLLVCTSDCSCLRWNSSAIEFETCILIVASEVVKKFCQGANRRTIAASADEEIPTTTMMTKSKKAKPYRRDHRWPRIGCMWVPTATNWRERCIIRTAVVTERLMDFIRADWSLLLLLLGCRAAIERQLSANLEGR